MIEQDSKRMRTIKSFVLRGGRMTAGQQNAFDRNWAQMGLEQSDGMLNYAAIFGRQAPVVVEIGFGMGQSLADMARAEPDKDFIGIEVHRPGVGKLMLLAEEAGITNLKVYCDDAVEVLKNCIEDGSLERMQLYFPDPWHKKKHNKRRIVQATFVQQVRQKLALSSVFHMATDWQPYAEQMLEVMSEADGYSNAAESYASRPDWRPVTKFERRGERLGHGVWDLLFKRES
jgi:tRNA (guanine-N7-)-methyltransferase